MKVRDLLLPLLAIGSIVYATTSIVRTQPNRELTDPPNAPPRPSYAHNVAAVGLIEPSSEPISIGSARAGVVDQVFVTVGDTVKKNQPLLKLRTSELEAELAVANAAVTQAEAAVEVAQSQVTISTAQVKIASAELANVQRLLDFAESVKDSRVISDEERTQRKMAVLTQQAKCQSAEASVASARSSVASAKAAVVAAKAQQRVTQVEIERSTITAPLNSTVLQLRIRPGEYVSSATSSNAWLTLGQTQTLHLRADVDEHEAWRIKSQAEATAHVRGNAELKSQLTFVRFEPLVIPKKSLTGDATERVDTRVLQVIYRLQNPAPASLFIGQQMDVFIAADSSTK